MGSDGEEAADRLEAALERIARLTTRPATPDLAELDKSRQLNAEIARRLDSLIELLRAALSGRNRAEESRDGASDRTHQRL